MELKNWNPTETMNDYLNDWNSFSMIVSGMTRCGKSYLVRDILSPILPRFDFLVVFSKTLCNGFYSEWLKTKFLFDEFREDIVMQFKQMYEIYKQKKKQIKTLFIVDDCLSTSFKYENSIGDLFMTSRHWEASVVIIGQKMSYYSTSWMSNCLIYVIMFCGSAREKKYIAENVIADAIDNELSEKKMAEIFREAYKLQSGYCKDYNSIVILPMEHEKIYQYKALN